jgi:hypothetical protein
MQRPHTPSSRAPGLRRCAKGRIPHTECMRLRSKDHMSHQPTSRLQVDYYGVATPLKQMGTVTVPDASTLCIMPFEKASLKEIEKAIQVHTLCREARGGQQNSERYRLGCGRSFANALDGTSRRVAASVVAWLLCRSRTSASTPTTTASASGS